MVSFLCTFKKSKSILGLGVWPGLYKIFWPSTMFVYNFIIFALNIPDAHGLRRESKGTGAINTIKTPIIALTGTFFLIFLRFLFDFYPNYFLYSQVTKELSVDANG